MKLDSLRKIIREEVRNAVQDELKDILKEAVKFASEPNKGIYTKADTSTRKWSVDPVVPKPNRSPAPKNLSPLTEMLNMTQNTMTAEDANNIMGGAGASMGGQPSTASSVAAGMGRSSGQEPGLDISNLDFVKKAKSVLDLANTKKQGQLS